MMYMVKSHKTKDIRVVAKSFLAILGFEGALVANPGLGAGSTLTPQGRTMNKMVHQIMEKTTMFDTQFID